MWASLGSLIIKAPLWPLGTSVSPRPSPRRRRALNPLPPEWPSSRITPCSSVFWSNRLPGANGELLSYLQFLDLMTLLFLQCCSLFREDFGTFGTYKIPDCVCNYVCEWMEVLYTTQWMLVFLCMCLHKYNICIYIYIYIIVFIYIYMFQVCGTPNHWYPLVAWMMETSWCSWNRGLVFFWRIYCSLNLCRPWTHLLDWLHIYIAWFYSYTIIRKVYLDKLQSVTNPMHCKHVQDVLNLWGFIVMALCGGLCMTENSSTPRQGNAEDRADYSSFSALLNRVSNIDFNVELKSNEANSISHRWYKQHAHVHASQLMWKECRFKILTNCSSQTRAK